MHHPNSHDSRTCTSQRILSTIVLGTSQYECGIMLDIILQNFRMCVILPGISLHCITTFYCYPFYYYIAVHCFCRLSLFFKTPWRTLPDLHVHEKVGRQIFPLSLLPAQLTPTQTLWYVCSSLVCYYDPLHTFQLLFYSRA